MRSASRSPIALSPSRTIWPALLLLLLSPAFTGCTSWFWTGPSELEIVSQNDAALRLQADFNTAVYSYDSSESVTIVLLQGTDDDPIQAAVVRLMWNPKAGYTPINANATNATIQYLVFADAPADELGPDTPGEVGVYSGAGFLYLESDPGDNVLAASLWQADLLIADRSDRFNDLLGQSVLRGSFNAELDPDKVTRLLKDLSTRATTRLGYPRLVFDRSDLSADQLASLADALSPDPLH